MARELRLSSSALGLGRPVRVSVRTELRCALHTDHHLVLALARLSMHEKRANALSFLPITGRSSLGRN